MKKIQVCGRRRGSQTLWAIVDDANFEHLNQYHWTRNSEGYVLRWLRLPDGSRRPSFMHREVLKTPSDKITDHINGDRLDNRIQNLRSADDLSNARNRRINKNNKSGYKGVTFNCRKRAWAAQITDNYKNIFLGYFPTAKEAAIAYNEAAVAFYGDFAHPNIISEIEKGV